MENSLPLFGLHVFKFLMPLFVCNYNLRQDIQYGFSLIASQKLVMNMP